MAPEDYFQDAEQPFFGPDEYTRFPTGSPGLDEALGGGVPMGQILVLRGPGASVTRVVEQEMIRTVLEAGEPVVYYDLAGRFAEGEVPRALDRLRVVPVGDVREAERDLTPRIERSDPGLFVLGGLVADPGTPDPKRDLRTAGDVHVPGRYWRGVDAGSDHSLLMVVRGGTNRRCRAS